MEKKKRDGGWDRRCATQGGSKVEELCAKNTRRLGSRCRRISCLGGKLGDMKKKKPEEKTWLQITVPTKMAGVAVQAGSRQVTAGAR